MNEETLAIVGVGPSIGMSLARRFGREGYRVGLIARNQERLDGYVEELRGLNIDAAAFAADVKDRPALEKALAGIEARFGAIGVTALLRYVQMLHMALKPKGIYVGTLSVGRRIIPEEIADIYWQKIQERTRCETLYGDPRYLAIYEGIVSRGYARAYPPELLKDLPEPLDEAERNLFLIALFHIKTFIRLGGVPGTEQAVLDAGMARVLAAARRLGGNEQADFFGADIEKVMRPFETAM